jgi:uncharacterized membrane protein
LEVITMHATHIHMLISGGGGGGSGNGIATNTTSGSGVVDVNGQLLSASSTAPTVGPITLDGNFVAFIVTLLLFAALSTLVWRRGDSMPKWIRVILVVLLAGMFASFPIISLLGRVVNMVIKTIVGAFVSNPNDAATWVTIVTVLLVAFGLAYFMQPKYREHHPLVRFFVLTLLLTPLIQLDWFQTALAYWNTAILWVTSGFNTAWAKLEHLVPN